MSLLSGRNTTYHEATAVQLFLSKWMFPCFRISFVWSYGKHSKSRTSAAWNDSGRGWRLICFVKHMLTNTYVTWLRKAWDNIQLLRFHCFIFYMFYWCMARYQLCIIIICIEECVVYLTFYLSQAGHVQDKHDTILNWTSCNCDISRIESCFSVYTDRDVARIIRQIIEAIEVFGKMFMFAVIVTISVVSASMFPQSIIGINSNGVSSFDKYSQMGNLDTVSAVQISFQITALFSISSPTTYMIWTKQLRCCEGALCVKNRHRLKTRTAGIPSAYQNWRISTCTTRYVIIVRTWNHSQPSI